MSDTHDITRSAYVPAVAFAAFSAFAAARLAPSSRSARACPQAVDGRPAVDRAAFRLTGA